MFRPGRWSPSTQGRCYARAVRGALTAARLRPRVGIDDAIGASLTIVALVLTPLIGVHDARRPVYGPIDEITHTAYVLAVAKDGIPPMLGRDRAFIRPRPLAPRDVRIPLPDKVGSAPVPIGAYGEVSQTEAIQPPLYYYAAAPVTWFVSGRDNVVALRLFDVLLCLCAHRDRLPRRARHRRLAARRQASRRCCSRAPAGSSTSSASSPTARSCSRSGQPRSGWARAASATGA